eukprot:tig00020848_g14603.t1
MKLRRRFKAWRALLDERSRNRERTRAFFRAHVLPHIGFSADTWQLARTFRSLIVLRKGFDGWRAVCGRKRAAVARFSERRLLRKCFARWRGRAEAVAGPRKQHLARYKAHQHLQSLKARVCLAPW